MPLRQKLGTGPLHLLVDSTGMKLGGAGEWRVEKHGTSRRRSWRKLHIGIDGDSGEIIALELTRRDIDDGSRTGALLDQLTDPLASFTGDGAYDQDKVYAAVAQRHPKAAVIVPPRATAVPSAAAETAPTQRDLHLQTIAQHGRMNWQKSSGYNLRARVETSIGRYKRVIGDALRSRSDKSEASPSQRLPSTGCSNLDAQATPESFERPDAETSNRRQASMQHGNGSWGSCSS